MKIAVIGATGMTGAVIVDELLDRRHEVTAIARNPEKLAPREGLKLVAADLMQPDSITPALQGHDVVVCAFAPGHSMGPEIYKGAVEAGWRVKRAVKAAGNPYLIHIGGVGSLWTPRGVQMLEDPLWPAWYLNTASPEYLRHLLKMTGIGAFELLASERESIVASGGHPHADFISEEAHAFIAAMSTSHELAQGCRAAYEILSEDRTLSWTFASPPWFLMYGPRTGKYRITVDTLPLENDIPAGISVADMAIAIADEAENRNLTYKHWSAATDLA